MSVQFPPALGSSTSVFSPSEPAHKVLADLLTPFYQPQPTDTTELSKRVIKALQSSDMPLATQVFRAVWVLSGRPEGDPRFGEHAFFKTPPLHEDTRKEAIASALNVLRNATEDVAWAVSSENTQATDSALQALEALSPRTARDLFDKMQKVSSDPSKDSDPEFGCHAFQNPNISKAEKLLAIASILLEISATPLQLLYGAIQAKKNEQTDLLNQYLAKLNLCYPGQFKIAPPCSFKALKRASVEEAGKLLTNWASSEPAKELRERRDLAEKTMKNFLLPRAKCRVSLDLTGLSLRSMPDIFWAPGFWHLKAVYLASNDLTNDLTSAPSLHALKELKLVTFVNLLTGSNPEIIPLRLRHLKGLIC